VKRSALRVRSSAAPRAGSRPVPLRELARSSPHREAAPEDELLDVVSGPFERRLGRDPGGPPR
jgi:hypothetical protein